MAKDKSPFVSAVVATYNRKELLRRCIVSLLEQTYPKDRYEIIVVDDGSTDGTEDVIRPIAQRSRPRVRYFKQGNKGPAAARNSGVRHAQGEIIAFTDDDGLPTDTWIENGIRSFTSEDIAGVQGTILLSEPVRVQFLPPRLSRTVEVRHETWNYATGNLFLRKQAILKVGGFREQFKMAASEDVDLAWRIIETGMRIVFSTGPLVYHPVSYDTLAARLRSMKKHQFDALLFKHHPQLRKKLLFGFVYGREGIHAPVFALAVLIGFLGVLLGMGLLPGGILALAWIAVYLRSNVFVDRNIRQFPLRIALFPYKLLLHCTRLFHHLLGSIRYRSLIV